MRENGSEPCSKLLDSRPCWKRHQDAWNLVPLRALQTLFFARRGDVAEVVRLVAWLEDGGLHSESPQSVAVRSLCDVGRASPD